MASNVQYYEDVLKEVYAPAISKEFIRNKPALEKIEKSSEYVDLKGRYYDVPLALQANQSVGTATEFATITAPTQTVTASAKYFSYIQWGVCQLSKRALDASTNFDAAWENLKDFEFASIIEMLRQNVNRQVWGDGTGALAACGSMGSAGATVPISSTYPGTKYLFKNMYIDIVNKTNDTVLASNRQITTVNAGTSIVISGANVQTTTDHVIVRSGAYKAEWTGFDAIIKATGAIGGVDPSTQGYGEWAAYNDTTGGNVSMPLIQKGFDAIELKGGKVDVGIASYGVYRAMANYMESMKRIPVEGTAKLPGGMSGITWNGTEIFKDQDAPNGTLVLLDLDAIQIGQVSDPGWLDTGGTEGGILHYIPRTFTYEATYYWDSNLIVVHRNRLARIQNITEA